MKRKSTKIESVIGQKSQNKCDGVSRNNCWYLFGKNDIGKDNISIIKLPITDPQ